MPEDDRNPPGPPPVDPALAQSAITRIRKQVQGNGLKPSSVELRGMQGHIHAFFGTTSVHFVPDVREGRRSGRFGDGQIIQPNQVDAAIGDFIGKVAADRGVLAMVHETILARPDRGFGIGGETIPLPQVSRNFIAHEPCPKCRGSGGSPCHNCHGQMRITCYRCHGQGGVPCITCQGRGQILTPHGPATCHACNGRGLSPCPVCQGQRMITCPECQGQGRKVCDACTGHGWTTRNWTVTLTARTVFRLRTYGLPPALVSLIDRVGPARLAADQHARVTPILGREAEHFSGEADIDSGAALWFLYRAEMPFAELDIAMGKTGIRPKLAGFRARLVDVPDFMDVLLRPGMEALADAAAGGAASGQKILESARYRALGDTLRGLVRGTPKRALKSLGESYSLGMSENAAKKIVKDANTALLRLSLWPRTVTMIVMLAAGGALDAGFYLYGLRARAIEAFIPASAPAWGAGAVDVALLLTLGVMGTHAIRLAASRASKTVLEGLGVVTGARAPLPKPGAPGLWLWLALIAISAGFAILSGLAHALLFQTPG